MGNSRNKGLEARKGRGLWKIRKSRLTVAVASPDLRGVARGEGPLRSARDFLDGQRILCREVTFSDLFFKLFCGKCCSIYFETCFLYCRSVSKIRK